MIFADDPDEISHPAERLSRTGIVYRWNTDHQKWEFWSSGAAVWLDSSDFRGQPQSENPISSGNAVVLYAATWAEPMHIRR